uniref:EIF-4F 25 kDa subunit n=1 Tax=Trichuris muris TaxID=70415 RepID=A0A5S6Q6A2_TRIMR
MEANKEGALHLRSAPPLLFGRSATAAIPAQNARNVVSPHYPLNHSWCLWFLDGESTATSWEERLDRVAAVSTLEQFGVLYQSMKAPSELSSGSDLYFFKRGIRPQWDHPANVKGGRWVISMGDDMERMDCAWLRILTSIVGNWFDDLEKEICGVAANVRKRKSKICVWTKCGSEKNVTMQLGRLVKEFTEISGRITYELHEGRENDVHKAGKVLYSL